MKGQVSIEKPAVSAGNLKGQVAIEGTTFPARHLKGQVSTELLVIIGVVLVIFIPILVMVYFKANDASAQIGAHQAELAVFRMAYLANSVGALGTDTSITTEVYIPQGVKKININNIGGGAEVVFTIDTPSGESEIVEIIKYPIDNPLIMDDVNQGWARFTITSEYVENVATLNIVRSN